MESVACPLLRININLSRMFLLLVMFIVCLLLSCSYDMVHYGHSNQLRQAKAMGDHLTVGVHTDGLNLNT